MAKARSIATNQVSVGTTVGGTKIIGANSKRVAVTITNTGASAVFVGASGLTTTTGHSIAAGASFTFQNFVGDVYGIVASGTVTVSYVEEYDPV